MRLELFDRIDETTALLRENREEFQQIRKEVKYILLDILKNQNDMIMDISSRIKTENSLREKIIRNRLYLQHETSEEILYSLSDIIGLKVECRFIDEEWRVYKTLKDYFNLEDHNGYFTCKKYPYIKLELGSKQPQLQRNGFTIYRIDGYYERGDRNVNFELQIKSMVNSFWGDIEHKLVYKNTNYYVYDDFMKNLLSSINANLTTIDRQLRVIYDEMENSDRQQMGLVSETNFEKMLAKAINDMFTEKLKESIGFTINIKNTSDILGHYMFVKNIRDEFGNEEGANSLFKIFKKLNSMHIDFKTKISLEKEFVSNDAFMHIMGNHLVSIMNNDYEWYVFFQMLFALELGNNIEDFNLFIEILKDYLVDDYWFRSSFMRLSLEEAASVQNECMIILANALCEIGTIKIIYNEKLTRISDCFATFIQELNERVISYSDFKHYKEAYQTEFNERIHAIF